MAEPYGPMKEIKIEERIFCNYISALRKACDDVKALRAELDAIEAIQLEDGRWMYPFYLDGIDRYLPRDDWIQARKDIGKHIKQLQKER